MLVLYSTVVVLSMTSKAAVLLGLGTLDGNDGVRGKSNASVQGSGIISVQHSGFLYKKSLSKGKETQQSHLSRAVQVFTTPLLPEAWNKRWFVLKDGFLIWYRAKPRGGERFHVHCKGFMPVAGCQVFPSGKDGAFYQFDLSWSLSLEGLESSRSVLMLKSDCEAEVKEWMKAISHCAHINWQTIRGFKVSTRVTEEQLSQDLLAIRTNLKQVKATLEEVLSDRIKVMEAIMKEKATFRKQAADITSHQLTNEAAIEELDEKRVCLKTAQSKEHILQAQATHAKEELLAKLHSLKELLEEQSGEQTDGSRNGEAGALDNIKEQALNDVYYLLRYLS